MAKEDMEHADAPQDAEMLRPIVEALVNTIETLASRIDQLENGHGALSKLVTDDLIGGLHSMYVTKMRNDRIEGLKTKYGELLGPHFADLDKLSPGDHWGALHDMTEGKDGDELDGHIKALAEGLGKKFSMLRGGPAEVKVEEGELSPEAAGKLEEGVSKIEDATSEEPDEKPKKKSKDELIAEKMRDSKDFKLR